MPHKRDVRDIFTQLAAALSRRARDLPYSRCLRERETERERERESETEAKKLRDRERRMFDKKKKKFFTFSMFFLELVCRVKASSKRASR